VTIALNIFGELRLPKSASRLGVIGKAAALVPMPKTAVNEYRGLKSSKNNVRTPGKPRIMQSVTNALCMKIAPYLDLGLGIRSFDR
jgi:hypothetical protein